MYTSIVKTPFITQVPPEIDEAAEATGFDALLKKSVVTTAG
jgi:hypothetical protein